MGHNDGMTDRRLATVSFVLTLSRSKYGILLTQQTDNKVEKMSGKKFCLPLYLHALLK